MKVELYPHWKAIIQGIDVTFGMKFGEVRKLFGSPDYILIKDGKKHFGFPEEELVLIFDEKNSLETIEAKYLYGGSVTSLTIYGISVFDTYADDLLRCSGKDIEIAVRFTETDRSTYVYMDSDIEFWQYEDCDDYWNGIRISAEGVCRKKYGMPDACQMSQPDITEGEMIEVYPHEKIVIDGCEVYFGMNRENVSNVLGFPQEIDERCWIYREGELSFAFSECNELESIAVHSFFHEGLKPILYGISVFGCDAEDVVNTVRKHCDTPYGVDDEESHSIVFFDADIELWQDKYLPDSWTDIYIGIKGFMHNRYGRQSLKNQSHSDIMIYTQG